MGSTAVVWTCCGERDYITMLQTISGIRSGPPRDLDHKRIILQLATNDFPDVPAFGSQLTVEAKSF